MKIISEELGNGKGAGDPYLYVHSFSGNASTMIAMMEMYDNIIFGFSHIITKVKKQYFIMLSI